MNRVIIFFRFLQICKSLAKYQIDTLFSDVAFLRRFRWIWYLNPWRYAKKSQADPAVRLRLFLQTLGPIYVKLGQIISTRRDLLPNAYADELAKLQDHVPPFASNVARLCVEKAFETTIENLFAFFDDNPLAAASIAQVHAAILKTGEKVVVKIIRPNIIDNIKPDLLLMRFFAGILHKYHQHGDRLKPLEVVDQFEKTLYGELNLKREAASAALLRRNFPDSPIIYIPKIYWPWVSETVLVMEKIEGVRISDMATLKAHQVNLKKLAEDGVEIFFTQVFRDRFFHADMHPGNIFVDIRDPKNPQYRAIDFGIMGTLSTFDQRYLAENLLAFFYRDYEKVALLHVQSGWVPAHTNVEDFTADIRTVCEPIFALPLAEISFARLIIELIQTARKYKMPIQPQLLLLHKTLLNVEGLGRELYPQLDLWQTGKPYLERWVKQQMSLPHILKKIVKQAPYWLEKFPEIPDLIYQRLKHEPTPTPVPTPPTLRYSWCSPRGIFIGVLIFVAGNVMMAPLATHFF